MKELRAEKESLSIAFVEESTRHGRRHMSVGILLQFEQG